MGVTISATRSRHKFLATKFFLGFGLLRGGSRAGSMFSNKKDKKTSGEEHVLWDLGHAPGMHAVFAHGPGRRNRF